MIYHTEYLRYLHYTLFSTLINHHVFFIDFSVKSANDFAVTSVTPVSSNKQYRKGDTLVLKCGGKVGNPPEVPTWCRKTYSESSFSLYTSSDKIAVTSRTPQECQFERFSMLEYKVADIDSNTEFKCIPSYKKCNTVSSTRPFIIRNTKTGMETDSRKVRY